MKTFKKVKINDATLEYRNGGKGGPALYMKFGLEGTKKPFTYLIYLSDLEKSKFENITHRIQTIVNANQDDWS